VGLVDGCIECQRAERTNPGDFHETSTDVNLASGVFEVSVNRMLIRDQPFGMVRQKSQLSHQVGRPIREKPPDLCFHRGSERGALGVAPQPSAEKLNLTAEHTHRCYALTDQMPANCEARLQSLAFK
jgi:hypothetical protein